MLKTVRLDVIKVKSRKDKTSNERTIRGELVLEQPIGIKGVNRIYYHGTLIRNMASIRSNGLLCRQPSNYPGISDGNIHLCQDIEDAILWSWELAQGILDQLIVCAIRLPNHVEVFDTPEYARCVYIKDNVYSDNISFLLPYDFISMITDRNTKLYKALQTYVNPTVYTM